MKAFPPISVLALLLLFVIISIIYSSIDKNYYIILSLQHQYLLWKQQAYPEYIQSIYFAYYFQSKIVFCTPKEIA